MRRATTSQLSRVRTSFLRGAGQLHVALRVHQRRNGSRSLPRGREPYRRRLMTSAILFRVQERVRHIRLVIEYDGTTLHGWQRQANEPTVQQHLEEALAQLLQHETAVTGASRTDAGVHAVGQVASFRTERAIPLHGIRRGLNSLLPDTIAVRDVEEVADDFHPRFSATGKHYRYTILLARDRSPRWRDRAWHHPEALDREAMRAGAAHLIGEHDFSAFRAAGCTAKTAVRRIDSIDLTTLPTPFMLEGWMVGVDGVEKADGVGKVDGVGELLLVDVRGNAFLRNMVRIVVGTLVEVGTGKRPAAQVAEILASRDRTRGGITAPAQGLELVAVRYDGRRVSPESDSR
jgi:tRNA pseudouridine38-40 synthase